ncbi:hypothetical protein RM549_11175 [Salegentibacter sp. F188]|uniref:Uncharacterized protein n=1 Tax=Autumnicola patrickiae TaxID=3075591 RepID=A0ABU3E2X4_9FLAO|nr:hypothetical protein [Salegentibacter sp. F188]MDT0690350.1 hypothetical protein [Salegentibacter sp. F188]
MEDVDLIYHNKFGIAFRWKNSELKADPKRIQLVFKDMGFYLLREEILQLSNNIQTAAQHNCCKCDMKNCRSILIKSPLLKMDFAVTREEMEQISDLIEGTLFRLNLLHYLDDICKN